MLDKKNIALLEIINKKCEGYGYKIFSYSFLEGEMPSCFGVDENFIKSCIKTLSKYEYISVKFFGDKEVCLAPLSRGILELETKRQSEQEDKVDNSKKHFGYSFLGAILGSLITGIALILFFVLGVV